LFVSREQQAVAGSAFGGFPAAGGIGSLLRTAEQGIENFARFGRFRCRGLWC